MILQGILDNSLNGQLCIRGFANIKDLARLSTADYSYQRGLIERSDISDFLENQSYLFFPEVILSYKIPYKLEWKKDGELKKVAPLKLIQEGKTYISNVDKGIELRVKKVSMGNESPREITLINLFLNDEYKKPFHRIDGNHRLNAAEQSQSEKVERMVIPFCLLLGTEYHNESGIYENQESKEFDKAVKVFFHNINTKTIPLTSEENLKVIIDDVDNFPNEELREIFGGSYPIKTRELIKKEHFSNLSYLRPILEHQYRTLYNSIFYRLLEDGVNEDEVVEKVLDALQEINILYKDSALLKGNQSIGLLTAFIWYHIQGHDKYIVFKNWVIQNHIYEIEGVKTDGLIKIFNKIHEQEIKVFIAMPYFEGNSEIIAEYNKIYKDTIEDIAHTHKINISNYPIMCNKGATSDQIQDIINKIKDCKICIADITDNNPNVSYEMGWARALEKHVIIVKKKESDDPKSDYQNDTYHEYDDKCRSISLPKIIKENLVEILSKNFGLIHMRQNN